MINLNLLHINSYFICTSLYWHLYKSLSERLCKQYVWVPHQKNRKPAPYDHIENIQFDFDPYQDIVDRLFFSRKISKGLEHFSNKKIDEFDFIHAHTLFSDGALAYEINRRNKIPYLVTIRDTDINCFWKYGFHLREYGERILRNAHKIIFLNQTYREKLCSQLSFRLSLDLKNKISVIPNGIDSFWIKNRNLKKKNNLSALNILFIGEFTKRKNIENIIKSCNFLRKDNNVQLKLIGAKNSRDYRFQKAWITIIPYCSNKVHLKNHYQWADVFVMPSFTETFGLVYAEALSQGVPIIYTKGQGFDGWAEEGSCGYGVDPNDPYDIADKIIQLKKEANFGKCIETSRKFNWDDISSKYLSIYEEENV